MADYVVQLWLENIPNSDDGGWRDLQIVRDLTADEAEKAATVALTATGETGRVRVVRWDTVVEFTATPGPPAVAKATKTA